MEFQEIFFYIGSSLAIFLSLLQAIKEVISIRNRIPKRQPDIKIDSSSYSWGSKQRSEEDKKFTAGFSKNLPDTRLTFGIELRLINVAKEENIVDICYYIEMKDNKRLNLGMDQNISLKKLIPVKIVKKDMKLNYANELMLLKELNLKNYDKDVDVMKFAYSKLKNLCVLIIDAHNKRKILKLTL